MMQCCSASDWQQRQPSAASLPAAAAVPIPPVPSAPPPPLPPPPPPPPTSPSQPPSPVPSLNSCSREFKFHCRCLCVFAVSDEGALHAVCAVCCRLIKLSSLSSVVVVVVAVGGVSVPPLLLGLAQSVAAYYVASRVQAQTTRISMSLL